MYKWLLRYIERFGSDFPVSAVKDRTEYEIVRIIQDCCIRGVEYAGDEGGDEEEDAGPVVGEAIVGMATL